MFLKKATEQDEAILKEWLQNKEDCLLVTNQTEYSSQDFFNWLKAEDQQCYCLVDVENQIIGYGEIWVDECEKDLELAHLIINPSLRNRGYGKILLSLLEEKAMKFNFPIIYLRVNPQNVRAIHCYEKCNYQVDPTLSEVFGKTWTWLKKELTVVS